MTTLKDYKEKVLKEFEELLDKNDDWNCGLSPEELNSFLSQAIDQAYEAGRESVIKKLSTELVPQKIGNEATSVPCANQSNGECCGACGAWKQYGVADTHHCPYKMTC